MPSCFISSLHECLESTLYQRTPRCAVMNASLRRMPTHGSSILFRNPVYQLQLHTPNSSPRADAQPVATLLRQTTLWRPRNIRDLILAPPLRERSLALRFSGSSRTRISGSIGRRRRYNSLVLRVQQIPDEHQTVISTGREHTASTGIPFDTVEVTLVAAQFEECGTRLSYVENANYVAVGGEGRQEVGVVWRRGKAKERWCWRECLSGGFRG